MSGRVMVETFWPTVGTVFSLGGGAEGSNKDLTCSWKVVLPALSRPRRRTEYSIYYYQYVKSEVRLEGLG